MYLVDKKFGKCQLLDTIYSKENGVEKEKKEKKKKKKKGCTCTAVRLGVRLG